jgi:MFS family permease
VFGPLGDRYTRRYIIAAGVAVWSVATATCGLAGSFWALFASRACIGVGEAAYATIAPTLIGDIFRPSRRGRMMSVFYLAIPVGSALGFILGGILGHRFGWRTAFYVVGIPGILAALACLTLPEPKRGGMDLEPGEAAALVQAEEARLSFRQTARCLARIPSYVWNVLGLAAMTFAIGGFQFWMPAFLNRHRGLDLEAAGLRLGAIVVLAGIGGTFAGGWLGDWLLRRTGKAYLLLSGVGMLIAVPVSFVALYVPDPRVYFPALLVSLFFVFLNTGPANTAILNVVPPRMRATAFAMSIFFIHLLGDDGASYFVGWLSDHTGGLTSALLIVPAMMALSGILFLVGSLRLQADTDRVRAGWDGTNP